MTAPVNAALCQAAIDNVGSGVGASLRAIDCAAGQMAQSAFMRLFASGGALSGALTILLTLFVALIGFGLITGRLRIGLVSLTPRIVTLIAVVTFATSWLAFQGFFYNLVVSGPDQIARILMGIDGSATNVFADKIDAVMGALIQASGDQGSGNQTPAESASVFSPPGLMWLGGTLLLLGTVGVLATCKIALAVLMALGPVFIVMALFGGTRGLFVGWLKGAVMLAITPLFAVLGGSMMLELAVPVISGLGQVPGEIDARAAMAFFMIGAVHTALMVMAVKVAAAMVSGWTVFGLASTRATADARSGSSTQRAALTPAGRSEPTREGARMASPAHARAIRVAASPLMPANDPGAVGGTVPRETHIIGGAAGHSAQQVSSGTARARGIGSRFRTAHPRSTEKF